MKAGKNLVLAAALALWFTMPTGTGFGAQGDPKGPEQPAEADDQAAGGAPDVIPFGVIPGVETQGNGNTYVLLDSDDRSGPKFNDPAYAPATIAATLGDDNFEQANLGFAFEFYGAAHATVFISSNGYLTFNNGNTSANNDDLTTEPNVTDPGIFAFFDDLYPADPTGGTGEVRYGTFGAPGSRVFVVVFDDVYRFGPETSGGTFQIRLFETTNVIEYHYFDLVWGAASIDFGAGATIGIRAGGAGTPYLQYSSNTPQINDGLAVKLWPPTCGGKAVTLVGDRGADTLNGLSGVEDVIYGHHGDDTINGFDRSDTLCGGDGRDTIYGNAGPDVIDGGQGNDIIYGGTSDDDIFGAGGGDQLYGGPDDDLVRGGTGNDTIWGGRGNDELRGQNGEDEIWANTPTDSETGTTNVMYGGGLYDKIYGDNGDDILYGGDFADILSGRGGDDELYGNNGVDILRGGTHITGDYCNGGAINSGAGDTANACETIINVP